MPDKFPPKNSEFRLETFRFPSDATPCRHAIYHHGCPGCDRRDPEGDEVCAVCEEIYCPGCELAAAEKVMDPILRLWFSYDCAPHEVEHHAENAAVDLSWALQNAGLLVPHNDALMSEPITPMDGEALANMRHTHRERPSDTAVGYCDECGGHWPCDVATLLARLDVAEADLRSEIEDANELVELFRMALAERDAALASSPGMTHLPAPSVPLVDAGEADRPTLVSEAAAVISAFHAYATHKGDCGIVTVKSTEPGYRCTCGLAGWVRRVNALAASLRPLTEGEAT